MSRQAQVNLPDGRKLYYEIRTSTKARSLRLKMTARDGLTVVAPKGLDEGQVVELVNNKGLWIAAKLDKFEEVRDLLNPTEHARPEAFELLAVAENWRVEYRETQAKTVGARTDRQGRVLVYGAIKDDERCNSALRRWLARRAKESLKFWLDSVSSETGITFSGFAVRSQRTRWGSCSPQGHISLNCKLLFLPAELVKYVMVHELCHRLEPNHSNRFWSQLRQFEPQADILHEGMKDAWKLVPKWAHRNSHVSL